MPLWIKGPGGLSFIEATGFQFEKSPGPGDRSVYYLIATNESHRMLIGRCASDEQAKKAADELWEMLPSEQKVEASDLVEKLGLKPE